MKHIAGIWKFLNSPLIVVTAAVLCVACALTQFAQTQDLTFTAEVHRSITSLKQAKEIRDVIALLKISDVGLARDALRGNHKIIGTVSNASDRAVRIWDVTASLRNSTGGLLDVSHGFLHDLPLYPGQSLDFEVLTSLQAESLEGTNLPVCLVRISSMDIMKER